MPKIEFRTKVQTVTWAHGAPAYDCVYVPELQRNHCDMDSFHRSKAFGGLSNSTIFPNILKRIKKYYSPHGYIRLDKLPDGVKVDTRGFLAVVTIETPDNREFFK